jgi:hypothetical protein
LGNNQTRSKFGIEEVVTVERPHKPGWKTVEQPLTLVGNSWTQTWDHEVKDVNSLWSTEITQVPLPIKEGFGAFEGTPELVGDEWRQTWNFVERGWLDNRKFAYGAPEEQLEFITENGLEAWQARVAEIKAKYPKT